MVTTQSPLCIFCGYAHEDETLFQQLKKALAIPILLKPTPDWETPPLGALQALPTIAKPITIQHSYIYIY